MVHHALGISLGEQAKDVCATGQWRWLLNEAEGCNSNASVDHRWGIAFNSRTISVGTQREGASRYSAGDVHRKRCTQRDSSFLV